MTDQELVEQALEAMSDEDYELYVERLKEELANA